MTHGLGREADYLRELEGDRAVKDAAFGGEAWSPIAPEARAGFGGLRYFPPDPAWRLRAKVTRLKAGAVFEMATSTGEPRRQVRAVKFEFSTPSGPAVLFGYKDAGRAGATTLFLPFRDATSGRETYGAGRYLDLEEAQGDELIVDFNLAYNPYCAYSEAYSCPLPPAENWLEIAVMAGEKSPPSH